jgi:hypothetical protein
LIATLYRAGLRIAEALSLLPKDDEKGVHDTLLLRGSVL